MMVWVYRSRDGSHNSCHPVLNPPNPILNPHHQNQAPPGRGGGVLLESDGLLSTSELRCASSSRLLGVVPREANILFETCIYKPLIPLRTPLLSSEQFAKQKIRNTKTSLYQRRAIKQFDKM